MTKDKNLKENIQRQRTLTLILKGDASVQTSSALQVKTRLFGN